MDDSLKKLVDEQLADKPAKSSARKARTLSYEIDLYAELQDHCRDHGLVISDVVNDLIRLYLKQVRESKKEKGAG